MNTLSQMLEDYRNGERGLPSYDELCVIAIHSENNDYIRYKALEEAVEICQDEIFYPGDKAGVDGQLNDSIDRLRNIMANIFTVTKA